MLRLLVKLALAALIANALWRAGSAYLTFYRFKDAVTEAAQYNNVKSPDELRRRILVLASDYGVPLPEGAVTVRRQDNHTLIDASYMQPVDLFPAFQYPWPFSFKIDSLAIIPTGPRDSTNPQ